MFSEREEFMCMYIYKKNSLKVFASVTTPNISSLGEGFISVTYPKICLKICLEAIYIFL